MEEEIPEDYHYSYLQDCIKMEQMILNVEIFFAMIGLGLYTRWPDLRQHGYYPS
jgi:hypothetical protein